ncbi:hypothetical protein CMV_016720 [Castanea mollissima]|uniref:Uncharacterized protein n=1 Tax=Castanea mollissima TaxID=60419 RepID=A0A8J4R3G0_9ROSI|nr:hypothetical protein CMV_016720 [Castanea mollissima]
MWSAFVESYVTSTGAPYATTHVISGAGAAAPNLKVIGIAGIKGANRIDLLDLETHDLTIRVALGEMQMTTLIRGPLQDAVLVYCF